MVLAAGVILVVGGVLVSFSLARRTDSTAVAPVNTGLPNLSSTTSAAGSTTPVAGRDRTGGPRLDGVEPAAVPGTFAVVWSGLAPGATTVVDVYEADGDVVRTQRLLAGDGPTEIVLADPRAGACVVLTTVSGGKATHSDPECVNGGTATLLRPDVVVE